MHAEYLHAIDVEKRQRAVDFVLDEIQQKEIQFDTIAVRGFSATSIGSMVAYLLKKPMCYVRKEEEMCCSGYRVECPNRIGKFLIIDDLIDSGNTMQKIIKAVTKQDRDAECVGAVLYKTRYYYDRHGLSNLIGMILEPRNEPSEVKPQALTPIAIDLETVPLDTSFLVKAFEDFPVPPSFRFDADFEMKYHAFYKISK